MVYRVKKVNYILPSAVKFMGLLILYLLYIGYGKVHVNEIALQI